MRNENITFYRQTMDDDELRKMVIDFLREEKMTKQDLAKKLGLVPTTIGNFLNGKRHLTPVVYKALDEFFQLPRQERKLEVKKSKTFIKPWMIRNLKNFGNTGVGNLSKKRTAEMVVKEFAKFGVDENEVVWLKGRE